MIDMNDSVKIQVCVRLPWAANEEKTYLYAMDSLEAGGALTPLPRNRELSPFEYAEASRHHERRKRLIELVAKMISNALMNACESEDTNYGYKKGEGL